MDYKKCHAREARRLWSFNKIMESERLAKELLLCEQQYSFIAGKSPTDVIKKYRETKFTVICES